MISPPFNVLNTNRRYFHDPPSYFAENMRNAYVSRFLISEHYHHPTELIHHHSSVKLYSVCQQHNPTEVIHFVTIVTLPQ